MDIHALAEKLGNELTAKKFLLTTAESCTGGWIAQVLTAVPKSSQWFERGFVTYSKAAKREMLAVSAEILEKNDAVSQEAAQAMAEGALRYSKADVSVAVTGFAGPKSKPDEEVGLVWFGFAGKKFPTKTIKQNFHGDRQSIREQAVIFALKHLIEKLK